MTPADCSADMIADDMGVCQCDSNQGYVRTLQRGCITLPILVSSILVPVFIALLAVQFFFYSSKRIKNKKVRALRKKLQIQQANGYLLGPETISGLNSMRAWCSLTSREDTFVVIPKPQMEAAVRLANCEEFDIKALDAFCCIIANYKMREAIQEHSSHRVVVLGTADLGKIVQTSINDAEIPAYDKLQYGAAAEKKEEEDAAAALSCRVDQLTRLRMWILEHAKGILEELAQASSHLDAPAAVLFTSSGSGVSSSSPWFTSEENGRLSRTTSDISLHEIVTSVSLSQRVGVGKVEGESLSGMASMGHEAMNNRLSNSRLRSFLMFVVYSMNSSWLRHASTSRFI